MRKRAEPPPNCAFCPQRIDTTTQRQHSLRHELELTEIYREIGDQQGVNVEFGSDCHSICCHQHTVHLRPRSYSHHVNVGEFIHSLRSTIHAIFEHPRIHSVRVRAQFILYATFESPLERDGRQEKREYHGSFLSRMFTATSMELEDQINQVIAHIEPKIEKFSSEKSGWKLKSLDALSIKLTCGVNHSGGKPVYTPPHLKKCRYVKILRGGKSSNHCFETAVRFSLAQRAGINMTQFRDVDKVDICLKERFPLNCKDMPFPFQSKYFHTFEKRNNIALRVYLHDGSKIRGTLYAKPEEDKARKVYLLYLANQERGEEMPGHFLPVTNMRALVNDIDKKSRRNLRFHCDYCLKGFRYQKEFHLHTEFCSKIEKPQRSVLPKNLTHHEFKDHSKTTQPINVVYADIEAMIQLSGNLKKHVPVAVGCQTVWHEIFQKDSCEQRIFIGESSIVNFLDHLEELVQNNVQLLADTHQKIIMNDEDQKKHNEAKQCAFCETTFDVNDSNKQKCADHCHLKGNYVQALCGKCNRKRRQSRYCLPVVFHNLKGYDAHHLMRYGLIKRENWTISPLYSSGSNCIAIHVDIPISGRNRVNEKENEKEESDDEDKEETYFNFRRTYRITFIDSLQFLKGSLENLSKNLESTPYTTNMMLRYYNIEDDTLKFTKGKFPYNFLNSMESLDEQSLPPIESFYDDLLDEPCSERDYERAKDAWRASRCLTFKDYLVYYLRIDVALLTDCFEQLRKTAFEKSGLDPIHFFGVPGFSFSFAYKFTGMKLQALPSEEMYLLFESACRGGMVFINRHQVESFYDPETGLQHHLFDADQNNLYGFALSFKLPKDGFRDMTPEEIEKLTREYFINSFDPEGDKGYLICCDLEYPTHVQDDTMDLPLAPETAKITWEELSPYSQQKWRQQRGNETFIPCQKLMMTHRDKINYVVHSTLLKYYLTKGLRLKKIHKAIEFNQEAYLKPYIDYHTQARSLSKNEESKQFHKLNVNSLFGKTMENPRKYKKSVIVRKPHYLFRHASSPLCDSIIPLDEFTCVVNLRRAEVQLSKPVFIGQAVLDISKLIMYKFVDSWKSNPLLQNVEIVGGDTDSLFLNVASKYSRDEILYSFHEDFDGSNYPPNHPLYSTENKAKLGCFKDESKGVPIKSLFMLSPKTYSILTEDDHRIARAKGIQTKKRDMFSHEDYRRSQKDDQKLTVCQTFIRSKNHHLFTMTQEKRALTCWDTKRFWLDDNTSVPYGHHRIPQMMKKTENGKMDAPPTKRRRKEGNEEVSSDYF